MSNCTIIQRRLLGCERPTEPPPEIRAHLDSCTECRAYHQRLVHLEQQVRSQAVPPSRSRGKFVLELLAPGEIRPLRLAMPRNRESGRQKVAVAFALAAGLAIFALGWWAWPHRPTPQGTAREPVAQRPNPRPDRHVDLNVRLAARTPTERVRRLSELAEDLHREAQSLGRGDADHLREVAGFYREVVHQHLLAQARAIPVKDRLAVLKVVIERLQRTESEATRLADELKAGAADAAMAFHDMAGVARDGSRELLALARDEHS